MLRNYFITAYRNLTRNKVYTLMNIGGLALGIGCALVIFKVVSYQFSYDKHQSNYDRIYRVVRSWAQLEGFGGGVPHPMANAIRTDFTDLESVYQSHFVYENQINVTDENGALQKFNIDGVVYIENQVFEVLDFNFLVGDPGTALLEPNTAVIDLTTATKLFGVNATNAHLALGNTINVRNIKDFKVTAVVKDRVETTDFPFAVMLEYHSQEGLNPYFRPEEWNSNSSQTNTYVLLGENDSPDTYNKRFPAFIEKYHGEGQSEDLMYALQPLSDVHFNGDYDNYNGFTISIEILIALALIGLFLVMTACVNFINLATAQAVNRAKEIGIRKVLGGHRWQLITQFMMETYLITFMAILLALGIAELLLINLDEVIEMELRLDLFGQPEMIGFILILGIVVGMLAGFYPAILLGRMNPILAIKNKITSRSHSGGIGLRRTLVTVQFTISQLLIIGTLVVASQMDYFINYDVGFRREAVITTYLPEQDEGKLQRLRNIMLDHPNIEMVSYGLSAPTGHSNSHSNFNYKPLGLEDDVHGNWKTVDEYYLELYDIPLLAGRMLRPSDTLGAVVINEKVLEFMQIEDPKDAIGEKLTSGFRGEKTVIGVMADFNTYSLHRDRDYAFLIYLPTYFYEAAIRLRLDRGGAEEIKESLDHIESSWSTVFPKHIYDYEFLDEDLEDYYETEKAMADLFQLFAWIAIFIGLLGLYGLIAFIANQKTKEIGVRKVLGASIWSILGIFSKELIWRVALAFLIAAPIGYWVMEAWLSEFHYRIIIGPWVFVAAILFTLTVSIFTMGYRAFRAAVANPAISLKDE